MNELVKAVGAAIGADYPEPAPFLAKPATTRPAAPQAPLDGRTTEQDAAYLELVELRDAAEDFPFRLLTACREAARITNSVPQWERFEAAVDAFVSAQGK
jgi:hypothetical protein